MAQTDSEDEQHKNDDSAAAAASSSDKKDAEEEATTAPAADDAQGCQMAKFDPFLSLDCARSEGVGAQSKERKGSNFAA